MKKKRLLIFGISLFVIFLGILLSGKTVEAAARSGKCGKKAKWTYDSSLKTLYITGSGKMYDYGGSKRPWEKYKNKVTSIEIGDKVTYIGEFAFEKMKKVYNVGIGNNVSKIGFGAFFECDLYSVRIPSSVATIGGLAFASNENLYEVTIENRNCKIKGANDAPFGFSSWWGSSVTIVGYRGSTAQSVAEMNNYTFEVFKGPTVAKGTVKEAFSSKKQTLWVGWKKLKKVSGYQIQISEKKDFTKGTRAKNFKASNTKAAAEGLKSGKKYYVRIRGYKNYQGKRIYGEWSKEKSVKVR